MSESSPSRCSKLVDGLGSTALTEDTVTDEGQRLATELEALSGLCGKVRRRVADGVFARPNTVGRATVKRNWKEVLLTFEGLQDYMNREIRRAGSGDTERYSSPS